MLTVITERLIIRKPSVTDLDDYLAYFNHPASLTLQSIKPKTEAEAREFLARQAEVETDDTGGWVMLAVELKNERKVIGEVGIFLTPQPQSQGDIGWSIHPDYQRQGYATEAAQVLFSYAFSERQLHRVTSRGDASNAASFRIMERLGMRREAHLRQSRFQDGAWQDEYQYGILRDEWLARQNAE
ncbi:MAG: GNAT family N-acetyltransferase [Janthinobacterium lividum]